jgi:hypothetical protein
MSRSGKQADLARRRGYAGAQASVASPKRKWPLRAVVGQTRVEIVPGFDVHREVLECGHTIGQAKDMIGDRYPARRRCGKCYRGVPPEASAEQEHVDD